MFNFPLDNFCVLHNNGQHKQETFAFYVECFQVFPYNKLKQLIDESWNCVLVISYYAEWISCSLWQKWLTTVNLSFLVGKMFFSVVKRLFHALIFYGSNDSKSDSKNGIKHDEWGIKRPGYWKMLQRKTARNNYYNTHRVKSVCLSIETSNPFTFVEDIVQISLL